MSHSAAATWTGSRGIILLDQSRTSKVINIHITCFICKIILPSDKLLIILGLKTQRERDREGKRVIGKEVTGK